MAENNSQRAVKLRNLWSEHGWPILLYFLLSIGLTWPMAANFTTHIPGDGYDAYNGLWVMWHTKEALLGHQPFFELPNLFYPTGATLFTHIPGLATGFFALPFWPLGPEAAHNGAVLISFILTGYFTYLLGRTIGLKRSVAFFAGLLLLLAPMHLLGLRGHTTKVYLGSAPLVLLCLFRVFDLGRSKRSSALWASATGLGLLLALLHDSSQFLTSATALLLVTIYILITANATDRLRLFQRFLVVTAAGILFAGPLFLATANASFDPAFEVDYSLESFQYQPDLTEFIIPSTQSRLFGDFATDFFQKHGIAPLIETAVSISWVALPLSLLAFIRKKKQSRFWVAFSLFWIILSFGPTIRILNQITFTEYKLPIIMPYAFLTDLPGLGFLRTPGRFMATGFVGVAITAAIGLSWLRQRWPKQATFFTMAAICLVLLESWPKPWQIIPLRPVPEFYQQLASDENMYGVLDIPFTFIEGISPIQYSATYQMYQMTHHKGIPTGYLSRIYASNPAFPCLYDTPIGEFDLRVNDAPAPCPFQPRFNLPLKNYRYIVVHKPQPEFFDYKPGTLGETQAAEFISRYLSDQTPIVDDTLTTVYEMPLTPDISALDTTLAFGEGWYGRETQNDDVWHWSQPHSELILTSPYTQTVMLEMLFFRVHIPSDAESGYQSRLHVQMENGPDMVFNIEVDQLTTIPLELPPGRHMVTMTLEAGSFQPTDSGGDDPRMLSFAVRYINLRTPTPSP